MKNNPGSDKSQELRKKAEEIYASKKKDLEKISDIDVKKLIQDLEVHQVELEMQNEELRDAQERLKESLQRYSDLYNFAPVGYFTMDEKGTILEANLTLAAHLGMERSLLINNLFYRLVNAEDRDIAYLYLRNVFENKTLQRCEIRLRKKDGNSFYALLESTCNFKEPEEGNPTCKASVVDITERKQVEEALQKSEEKYFDLYQNAPDGYHSIGPDGVILEVNNTWLEMLGYERDEVIGKMKITDFLTEDSLKIFRNAFLELKMKRSIENLEYELKRKDGTLLPVLINARAIYDEKGNFLRSKSIMRDNSVKKDYEKRLICASEQWRATFDSMPYGALLLDREFSIIKANNYIAGMSGLPIKELIGKKCYEVIHGLDKPIESCSLLKASSTYRTETLEWYEPRLKKYFMAYSTPILDEEGLIKSFAQALVDITASKEKEKRLIDSQNAFFNMLKDVDQSYKELRELYQGLIYSFVNAIDAKSPWTKGHSERVTNYAIAIAKEMGIKEKDIETLHTAALLHDIGKIGTYDVILDKPERLTQEEFELVKMHPAKGVEILKPVAHLDKILPLIKHHHETLDGKGYPDGLKGEEIPLCARILHVADSFDSMTADRPYRPDPGIEYAISELKKYSGAQFDPKVVEAFLKVLGKS